MGHDVLTAKAREIVTVNLATFEILPLTRGWELVLSPIWEADNRGTATRKASLLPRSMRAHYYEGAAREFLESDELEYVIDEVMPVIAATSRPADRYVAEVLSLYCDPEAAYFPFDYACDADTATLSCLIADAARKARVGMSAREIVWTYGGGWTEKMGKLVDLEEDVFDSVRDAPVEQLITALVANGSMKYPRA